MSVYAISDLHGNIKLWRQMASTISTDDTVFCLGDCADRGADGWEIIKDMLRRVREGNVFYIRGNHEQMLIDALHDYIEYDGMHDYAWMLLCQNGGQKTFEDAINDPWLEDWLKMLDKSTAPYFTYRNTDDKLLFLSHAGIPWRWMHHFYNGDFNKDAELQKRLTYMLQWNRDHYNKEYISDVVDIQVFGHTPIQYFSEDKNDLGAYWINEHMVDIDCGTPMSGTAVMLDLDTFDEHIFEVENG